MWMMSIDLIPVGHYIRLRITRYGRRKQKIKIVYNMCMGSGRGKTRRTQSIIPSLALITRGISYPNEEFGYEPVDVQIDGQHIGMPWRAPREYGGNPGDMYWLPPTKEFVVLHNKYVPAKNPDYPGDLDSGHKEVYRGKSLQGAVKAMQKIAAAENSICSPSKELLESQAKTMGFSSEADPACASDVSQVTF
jgi:hypothetical protein